MRLWNITIIGVLFAASPVCAHATPCGYDIMRQVADESFAPFQAHGLHFLVPQQWKVRETAECKIPFQVPYQLEVLGEIGCDESVHDAETLDARLRTRFQASFQIEMKKSFENAAIVGEKLWISGRPGGEVQRVYAFVGTLKNSGKRVFFYAITPEAWAETYRPLFDQMIDSMESP